MTSKEHLAAKLTQRKHTSLIDDIKWILKWYSKYYVDLSFLHIEFQGSVISYKSEYGRITYDLEIQSNLLKTPNGITLKNATMGKRTIRKSLITMLYVEELLVNAFQTFFAYKETPNTLKRLLPCFAKEFFAHPKYPYFT